jgi:NADH-quinone oxidoreductase subunit L
MWAAGLLFLGATGKSAQLPLYIWLPDAMAGPTPVSALIHAATMVTAGVYMIARLSFLYVQAPGVLALVAIIGCLTAFWGAIIGTAQNDIKKVLAYSTVSQLGFMFIGVGVGAFFAGTAHLITHAFFKACLFLGSGAVIHGLHGEQDISRMGGLRKYMPHTAITFAIATVAITGVLPISGFFSKDEILAQALNTSAFKFLTLTPDPSGPKLGFLGPLIYLLGTLTAGITSFYMWRCYLLTFHGEYRGPDEVHPHESPGVMTIPLWVLAVLSVVALVIALPIHDFPWSWETFTEGLFAHPRGGGPVERLPAVVTFGIAVVVAWAGFAIAWTLYKPARNVAGDAAFQRAVPRFHRALVNKLYVDEVYGFLFVRPLWRLAKGLWRVFDATIIDGLLVNGSAQFVAALGSLGRRFQNGDVQRYAAVTALGVAALVYLLLVRT